MAIWTCGCDFADCNLALISGATKIPTLGVCLLHTWPRYSLATCSPSICMWQGCQATTNFANQFGWRFLHMTCGTLWMWKLKNGHLFFRNQGPVLQSCPEHPGKAIPVEQTQPVTSSAIRLDSLMALRPMLRWTLLRCNDWCPADGSYQRGIVFFFPVRFLMYFFNGFWTRKTGWRHRTDSWRSCREKAGRTLLSPSEKQNGLQCEVRLKHEFF